MRVFVNLFYTLLSFDVILMFLAPFAWFFDLFINFVPQFSVISIVVLLVLLLQRRFAMFLPLFIVLLFFLWPLATQYGPAYARTNKSTETITVMQVNVNYENDDYKKVIDLIQQRNPTVIAFNEVSNAWIDEISAGIGIVYPYQIIESAENYQGMALFSKMPFGQRHIHELTDEDSPIIQARLQKYEIDIYNVHALSPVTEPWALKRDAMFQFLATTLDNSLTPAIVAGDFNSTIHSPVFRSFLDQSRLLDSRVGFGWEPSWRRGTPFALAIDHILYRGPGVEVTNFEVLDDIGSDHRPVLTTFLVNESFL